jgi:hypothetical protein
MTSPDVLAIYTRLRATQRALNRRLVKMLSKRAIHESAESLGFFDGYEVVVEDESDLDLVMDSAIYDHYPSGNKNAVARFASQHKLKGDEKTVVDAMLRARFTLVELGEPVAGIGVHAQDIVFEEAFFLADIALSTSAVAGLVIGTRLLTFEPFSMTTGVHLLMDEGALGSLVESTRGAFAGRANDLSPREGSDLARLLLMLGLMDPESARFMLADFAVAQLPVGDPRRVAYARIRSRRFTD